MTLVAEVTIRTGAINLKSWLLTVRGRTFPAEVVWGNWPGRSDDLDPQVVVPLRVKEL